MLRLSPLTVALLTVLALSPAARPGPPVGYYRQPTLHGDTVVFVSEGDLWRVSLQGGAATRLSSHPGTESNPAISPDGQTVAFLGSYEGPAEVYTMPLAGGRPERWTYEAGTISFVGWTPDGQLLYATDAHATLPAAQLVRIDVRHGGARTRIPLAQAAQGVYDDTGTTLFFTRLPFQGSHTKGYRGGTVQNLWKFTAGAAEAEPLTAKYTGTSKDPLWWRGRLYFASDRDGTMNLWSMRPDGGDLKQHTRHAGWDVRGPALHGGKVVYQLGADLRVYDIATDDDRLIPITLTSDLDQTRELWVKEPMDYLTSAHLSPDGDRLVLTARGRVFVVPRQGGRIAATGRTEGARYREARFLPDGKSLLALSDESGEVELWKLPADGVGPSEQLTRDADVLRWDGVPSPDGRWVAHYDKNQRLHVFDMRAKKNRTIDESQIGDFSDLRWSPDSRWLAYTAPADNLFQQIKLYHVTDDKITFLTTDRFDSYSPFWSPDGRWLYFLSDRNLQPIVDPSGSYQAEPFLDKRTKVYQIPLTKGLRSPFRRPNELEKAKEDAGAAGPAKSGKAIDLEGIQERLLEVPVPPGNYSQLTVTDTALYWLMLPTGEKAATDAGDRLSTQTLQVVPITGDTPEVKTVVEKVKDYEASTDGSRLLIEKDQSLYVIDAPVDKVELSKPVDLSAWHLAVNPREEWRQMFVEAWRLERDYFYDRNMHGLDWPAIRRKYEPLLARVHSRDELSDLLAQMVSELSALHLFVYGGHERKGPDDVWPALLGAELVRDEAAGGFRVEHLYRADPDLPELTGPLLRPGVNVREGDVIVQVNGRPALAASALGRLLRSKAGQQVRLRVKPAGGGAERDVIVKPISPDKAADLRYHEWEYTRRRLVDELGKRQVGYVHLRAMKPESFSEWARNFYPVFNRQGLIIDVRHNEGGTIDSWILGRLLRKAWSFSSPRIGRPPLWNMDYAFRGHLVVLCDESTGSDGEFFTEGFRRLGLGKVIGTRTWGGGIGLSFRNLLVDKGIATAAEVAEYGPEGKWLIEGHGVDPDIVVDNLPHATFRGEDAQLKAAVEHLQRLIKEKPVPVPPAPPRPNLAPRGKPMAK